MFIIVYKLMGSSFSPSSNSYSHHFHHPMPCIQKKKKMFIPIHIQIAEISSLPSSSKLNTKNPQI